MRLRRVIIGVAVLLLAVVAVAVGGTLWILRTESGARWVFDRVAARAGPVLAIERVSGTLLDGVTVLGIRLNLPGAEISIDRLAVSARLSDLIAGRLIVDRLDAGSVRYVGREATAEPQDPTAAGSSLGPVAESPIEIELRAVTVASLQIVTPQLERIFGATAFSAVTDGRTVELAGLTTSTDGIAIALDGQLATSDGLTGVAQFSWSMALDGVDWSGNGRVNGSREAIAVAHRLEAPFAVTAEGEIALSESPHARVAAEWTDVTWPRFDTVQRSSGTLEVDGWLDAFDFTGTGRAIVEGVAVELATNGAFTPEVVAFDELVLATEHGNGRFSGTLVPEPLSWDLNFDVENVDSGEFLPDWPGRVNATGRVTGALEPVLRWSVSDLVLDGTLRDQPTTARGNVASSGPNQWQLDGVELEWGGNRATLAGEIGAALDLAVSLHAPQLAALSPQLGGEAMLYGRLGGTLDSPSFTGSADATSFRFGAYNLDSGRIDGRVAALEDAEIAIAFEASGLRRDAVIAQSIVGRVDGTTASHLISIDIAPETGTGSIRGTGGWTRDHWQGEIESIVVNQDLVGTWFLEEPASLGVSGEAVTLDRACIAQNATRLCIGAEIGGSTAERVDVSLQAFDIATLRPLTGDQVTLEGLYDAELALAGPLNRPVGTLAISGRSSRISVADVEAPVEVDLDAVDLAAVLTESELNLSASVSAAADASVELEAAVTQIWTADRAIDAVVNGNWNDVAVLSVLSPDVGDVSGVATITLEVTGPLESPAVRGEARWLDGQVEVPQWGLVLRDVNAAVSSVAGNELIYALSGVAGEGRVELTGQTVLDADAAWPTTFRVVGDNLTAIQLPEAQILIAPELEVETAWPAILVTGTVGIPSATLSLDALPPQTVTRSADAVVHGVETAAPPRPLDVRADLRIVFGDDVRFSGSGLNAQLSGEIALDYRSGESPIATGTVSLAGEYATLGQTLALENGRLLFNGPVTDPGLDVRGVRRFETLTGEVLVGVLVTGTVRQPVTRLYSDPSMSDGDIVSYLVVGRPLSDSSRENSEALQTAALSLGLTQALPQIQHFGEAIGLDELGIRTSEANTGELMAGKQISSRVYMRYSYGLINRIGGLLLRFRLSERLRLETRTGYYKAMDLLYTVERD